MDLLRHEPEWVQPPVLEVAGWFVPQGLAQDYYPRTQRRVVAVGAEGEKHQSCNVNPKAEQQRSIARLPLFPAADDRV